MIPSGSNMADAVGSSSNAPFTIQDLDPEEAASSVLDQVQHRHPHTTTTTASSSFDALDKYAAVKTKVMRLEAALKARQEAAEHSASYVLQDMTTVDPQEEAKTSSYGLYARRRTQFTPTTTTATVATTRQSTSDGLMKVGPYDNSSNSGSRGLFQRRSNQPHHQGVMETMDRGQLAANPNGYMPTRDDGYVPHYFAQSQSTSTAGAGGDDGDVGGSGYYPRRHHPLNGKRHHRRQTKMQDANAPWYIRCTPRWMRECCAMVHPLRLANNCWDILVQSYFLWVGVPSLAVAAVLYYGLDNPSLYFLPGRTTVAMWLLFVFRQTVTLGLAQLTVYVLIDGLMLGTHLAVKTLGPLLTLVAATGTGWPAITTTWGLWNMILVHGNSKFQLNWLYWTNIELFNLNVGGYLVNSKLYTRCLVAAIVGGLAVSAKRTVFALRFGRKQVAEFRPRLKRALADVCLVDEIAMLAAQTLAFQQDGENMPKGSLRPDQAGNAVDESWSKLLWVPKLEYQPSREEDDDHQNGDATNHQDTTVPTPTIPEHSSTAETNNNNSNSQPPIGIPSPQRNVLRVKDLLDSWERPESANDNKLADISIHEILKFRRALAHLDEDHVFGDAFGSTVTRDDCIANSHRVYNRLLGLAKHDISGKSRSRASGVLPFEVLELLCVGDDWETENVTKKRKIRKIFTPDRSGELPLLAFVQAIDQCYKRLVFLRASLRNSSLLDDVLERLFNSIFYFILFLFLSSVLELHPWTLMVSITSILVSVSFAFGSSVSAYVDGVLLIAIRRPFDLGDRIFVSAAADISPSTDLAMVSWFVEDITLATTTLRCARTNEVCTVNNSSMASTRIVNLARSHNATIHFEFAAHLSIFQGERLEEFRKEMEKYVEERPRVWESVVHVRHGMFDADNERVDLCLALRHRSAWQEAGRIKNDTAAVYRFLYGLGNKIDVHFTAPPEQKVVYQGGTLRRGDTEDFDGRGLLARSNLRPIDPGHTVLRSVVGS